MQHALLYFACTIVDRTRPRARAMRQGRFLLASAPWWVIAKQGSVGLVCTRALRRSGSPLQALVAAAMCRRRWVVHPRWAARAAARRCPAAVSTRKAARARARRARPAPPAKRGPPPAAAARGKGDRRGGGGGG